MSQPIIHVENVSKRYMLGQFSARTMREELERVVQRFRHKEKTADDRNARTHSSEFWALKDVSFSVLPGEVIGIVGRNGAGKSTLLKILSRITEPTKGEIRLRGRVASLLEVGTGFHPELTGRENIYLNGAILGMTIAEVRAKFDEIVAFSEIEGFLDTPVKRYSSGMYVRLAFAVAAHLEPEILVVDEVLAVGDAEFQKKCLGKIQNVSAQGGRTVLFVSHNMAALTSLCSRGILLENGVIAMNGAIGDVTAAYLAPESKRAETRKRDWTDISSAPGDDRVRVRRVELVAEGINPGAAIEMYTPFRIEVDYWNLVEGAQLVVEIILRFADGNVLFHSLSSEDEAVGKQFYGRGLYTSICTVPGSLLNEGRYTIEVHFLHGSMSKFTSLLEAITFVVQDTVSRGDFIYLGRFIGAIHPNLRWTVEQISRDVDLMEFSRILVNGSLHRT